MICNLNTVVLTRELPEYGLRSGDVGAGVSCGIDRTDARCDFCVRLHLIDMSDQWWKILQRILDQGRFELIRYL